MDRGILLEIVHIATTNALDANDLVTKKDFVGKTSSKGFNVNPPQQPNTYSAAVTYKAACLAKREVHKCDN